MAYGDYDGPNKADKGLEGGSCNRTLCQAPDAIWYNHGSHSWYCADCRQAIEFDHVNKRHWDARFRPECGHPQFETRAMIEARREPEPVQQVIHITAPDREPDWPRWDDAKALGRKERMQFDAARRPAEIHTLTRQQRRYAARRG